MVDQRVLVTGGAGFIGSNLAEELVRENEVVIIDGISTGRMGNRINLEFMCGSILKIALQDGVKS